MSENIEKEGYRKSFENFERVVLEEFLPLYVEMKRRKNKSTGKIETVPTIMMTDIISLSLTPEETKRLVDFLVSKNVVILDTRGEKDLETIDYEHSNSYCNSNYVKSLSLSPKETIEKFKLYEKTKDEKIKEEIILGNLRLAAYFAWIYASVYHVDVRDLEQYGYEGLMYAVNHFNVSSGRTFATYASVCIKGFIKKGARVCMGLTTGIQWGANFLIAKELVEKDCGTTLEEDATLADDVVDMMIKKGFAAEKNRKIYENHIHMLFTKDSIEDLLEKGFDIYSNNDLPFSNSKNREMPQEIFDGLTDKELKVIKLRFGFDDGVPHTLSQIVKKMGLSREWIRQLEIKALNKIRNNPVAIDWLLQVEMQEESENKEDFLDEHKRTK